MSYRYLFGALILLLTGLLWLWNPSMPGLSVQSWLESTTGWGNSVGSWFSGGGGKFIVWWYLVGIICSLYWPWRYWKEINRQGGWGYIAISTPFIGFLGPLAFVARYPI